MHVVGLKAAASLEGIRKARQPWRPSPTQQAQKELKQDPGGPVKRRGQVWIEKGYTSLRRVCRLQAMGTVLSPISARRTAGTDQ